MICTTTEGSDPPQSGGACGRITGCEHRHRDGAHRHAPGVQQALWDARATNPFPVARPGSSIHEQGNAADVTINGRPIQDVVPAAELIRAGVKPLAGEAVHVDLAL